MTSHPGAWYSLRVSLVGAHARFRPSVLFVLVLTASQVSFLALRVSASSLLSFQLQWSEDARMYQGCNQLRVTDRKEASPIYQGGSWCGKFRRRMWDSRRRTTHRQRCFPKPLPSARVSVCLRRNPAAATYQFHPPDKVGLVSDWCALRAVARCEVALPVRCRCYKSGCPRDLNVSRSDTLVQTSSTLVPAELLDEPCVPRQQVFT